MPELEVPPTDAEVIACLEKVASIHCWGERPMLFLFNWEGGELNCGTMIVLDLDQKEIPPAIMFFAAESLARGDKPYLFLSTFEGWMVRVAPGASAEEQATALRQMHARELHTREDAVEQLILHAVTVDGRHCTGAKTREGSTEIDMSTTTAADGQLVAALQSSATVAGLVRKGEI